MLLQEGTPGGNNTLDPNPAPSSGGQFIVGIVFLALLLVFLMVAYFLKHMTRGQWIILRVISAICAGFAGGFFTGGAITNITAKPSAAVELTITATGGIAAFFVIWFSFPNLKEKPTPELSVSVGTGWTFEQTARTIAHEAGDDVDLSALEPGERQALMQPGEIKATHAVQVLERLRLRVEAGKSVRPYRVVRSNNGVFVFEVTT